MWVCPFKMFSYAEYNSQLEIVEDELLNSIDQCDEFHVNLFFDHTFLTDVHTYMAENFGIKHA